MDVVAAARVDAAHVDALDRARLGALEAGLAFERAPLVVQQLQASAELRRDLVPLLGVLDRHLRLEEAAQGQRHALHDAESGYEAHGRLRYSMRMIAPAVTKMLMNASSINHFQAKFISWSMRTRGRSHASTRR